MWPVAIAIDAERNLYISDEALHRISIFDTQGRFLGKWGVKGNGAGMFDRPAGIAFDPDQHLLVVDGLNNRIQRYTTDGRFLGQWGQGGRGPGELNLPWGITVDRAGDVYVADWRNDRLQKFDAQGKFLASYGRHRPWRWRIFAAGRCGCRCGGDHLCGRLGQRAGAGAEPGRQFSGQIPRRSRALEVGRELLHRQPGRAARSDRRPIWSQSSTCRLQMTYARSQRASRNSSGGLPLSRSMTREDSTSSRAAGIASRFTVRQQSNRVFHHLLVGLSWAAAVDVEG